MTGLQLKNSILQLAIQGKLVPQDPNDEPASVLLEKIRKEKEQLVKDGKLKKKDLEATPISEDEKPFEIPDSWEWIRLNNLAAVARGGSPRPIKDFITESKNGVNWIKIGDTEKGGKYINCCAEKIKPEGVVHSRMVHPGDFLLTNSMSFGRPYITNVEGCIHDGWLVISQYYEGYNPDFLYYLLSSPFAYAQFSGKTAGAVVQNLNKDKVAESCFPLPPLSDQQRIVAKIEELLPLVEEYDKAQKELDALNTSLPEALKKSILQEAIQGKLVPQDPNDEPASGLLEKIRKEKEQMVKDGKLKKKDLITTPISDDEKPFEIPESWEWVRWGDVSYNIQYGYNAPALPAGDIRMVRISDIQNGEVQWDTVPFCNINDDERETYLLGKNDILFARTGGTVGKSFLVKEVPYPAVYAGYLIRTQYDSCLLVPEYLKMFMESNLYWRQLRNGTIATAQPNCNGQTLSKMIVPLPPIAEQQRIVAKIEELFKAIDNLKVS